MIFEQKVPVFLFCERVKLKIYNISYMPGTYPEHIRDITRAANHSNDTVNPPLKKMYPNAFSRDQETGIPEE